MKNIFKTMLPILAMAACVWASCSDDKDDPTPGKPALPTIAVSEPALSADNAKAVVTVTPSEETEKWYWKCEPKGQSAAAYTAVTGKEEAKLEIPIDMDVTYTLTAYAENETGKSKEVSKEFTFKSEDVMTELVEFEVKNLSAFSMDVVVKKSAKCAKYVIGATPKGYMGTNLETGAEEYVEIYKEATFIENAETSLNPDESYPMQPYNWSDVSATFTERTLSRYALKDKDISESKGIILRSLEVDEIKMIIAVYALDAEGNSKVYTQEITIPEPEITGQVVVSIDVPKDKIKMRSFEATFTADANCSRIHVGQSSAGLIASGGKSFDNMTEEEICASIVRLGAEVPLAYTGAFSKEFASKDMVPNTSYIVYAIPIDKEGKIGKVVSSVPGKIGGAVGKIGSAIASKIPRITSAFSLLGDTAGYLGAWGGQIGSALRGVLGTVAGFIPSFVGLMNFGAVAAVVVAGLGLVYSQFGTQIDQILLLAQTKGPEIISNFGAGITAALPGLISSGATLILGLMNAITANLPSLISVGASIIATLVGSLDAQLPQLIPVAVQMILTLVESLISNLPQLITS